MRIRQHMKAILDSKCDTLHYYIIWKGEGHRQANFVRLWTLILPEEVDQSVHIVFNNILEMIMARIFQTLPLEILQKWFGAVARNSHSEIGLNVVPPLYQEFKIHLEKSPDPEIQAWPGFRRRQLEDNPKSSAQHRMLPNLRGPDYCEIFRKTIEHIGLSDITWSQHRMPSTFAANSAFFSSTKIRYPAFFCSWSNPKTSCAVRYGRRVCWHSSGGEWPNKESRPLRTTNFRAVYKYRGGFCSVVLLNQTSAYGPIISRKRCTAGTDDG